MERKWKKRRCREVTTTKGANPENMTDLLIVDKEIEDSVRTDLKEECVGILCLLYRAL